MAKSYQPKNHGFVHLIIRFVLVSLLLAFITSALYAVLQQNYQFRWNIALSAENLAAFNEALFVTIQVAFFAMIGGTILGLFVALARLSPFAILRDMGLLYLNTLRNIPFMVFILFMYFGVARVVPTGPYFEIPMLGLEIDARLFWGVLALSLFEASFISEIFRAGIQSIHKTQMEAARSIGMSTPQAMRYVILPQAFRVIIPPLTGELIALVKESALLMFISIEELTLKTRQLISQTPLNFEFYTILAVYYLAITLPLSLLSYILERKLSIKNAR